MSEAAQRSDNSGGAAQTDRAGGAAQANPAGGADQIARASERIEALLNAAAAGGDLARQRAEELVRLVADLYGAGLERLLDLLHERGRLDPDVCDALAGDELVSGLLLVHGLHPLDTATRIARALEGVRPYLASHGGNVELVDVTDGMVQLRLTGSCDGCASSAATLELAVEGAIRDAAPEVDEIEVLPPTPQPQRAGVIPIASLRARTGDAPRGRWETIPDAALATGQVAARVAGGVALALCATGSGLFAFRDSCPTCGSQVTAAAAGLGRTPGGDPVLRCPGCGAHFDIRHAGASLDPGGPPLQPLPLLVRDGMVQVAVPADAAGAAR
jgi:Fe-S cluster biogenesis protein NfuA/nitrite reductase/ring-hydroxylating ferredoxin subunit